MADSRLIGGRYTVKSDLGCGGTSKVYLCIDNHIGKLWAVKEIDQKNNLKELAFSEVKILKNLDYYMFPRIVDAFVEGSKYYIVTDYIEGSSLDKVLAKGQVLPEVTVIRYALELINAFTYLHKKKPSILFLDLKPSNIMMLPSGNIELIDFGIAKSIIEKGSNYGTAGYAAPEQYLRDGKLTVKTDVFTFGMTLYAMLTGTAPVKDYDVQRRLIKKNQVISPHLKKIILKCTEKNSNDRPYFQEIKSEIMHFSNSKKGKRAVITTVIAASLLAVLSLKMALFFVETNEKINSKKEMLKLISGCIDNGEYTREGIKIICGYLDGNFLDENSNEYYTYEVARNYFEIQKDYQSAKHYFERLDSNKYPETKYMSEICELITEFEDDSKIEESIEKFEKYVAGIKDEKKKENNEELLRVIRLMDYRSV